MKNSHVAKPCSLETCWLFARSRNFLGRNEIYINIYINIGYCYVYVFLKHDWTRFCIDSANIKEFYWIRHTYTFYYINAKPKCICEIYSCLLVDIRVVSSVNVQFLYFDRHLRMKNFNQAIGRRQKSYIKCRQGYRKLNIIFWYVTKWIFDRLFRTIKHLSIFDSSISMNGWA